MLKHRNNLGTMYANGYGVPQNRVAEKSGRPRGPIKSIVKSAGQ
ncbi:MAG TPA: hypothetical protein VFZ03_11595 [Dongiaceae bacterium]